MFDEILKEQMIESIIETNELLKEGGHYIISINRKGMQKYDKDTLFMILNVINFLYLYLKK